jgi:hypothetical protein
MRSGDRPGLQNRRAAGHPVTGGFDPHSLPPFFNNLQTNKSLANQLGFGKAICTTGLRARSRPALIDSPKTLLPVGLCAL